MPWCYFQTALLHVRCTDLEVDENKDKQKHPQVDIILIQCQLEGVFVLLLFSWQFYWERVFLQCAVCFNYTWCAVRVRQFESSRVHVQYHRGCILYYFTVMEIKLYFKVHLTSLHIIQ